MLELTYHLEKLRHYSERRLTLTKGGLANASQGLIPCHIWPDTIITNLSSGHSENVLTEEVNNEICG